LWISTRAAKAAHGACAGRKNVHPQHEQSRAD
jgi:hypothetical protein